MKTSRPRATRVKFGYAIVTINGSVRIAVRHQLTHNGKEDADIARAVARQALTNVSGSYGHVAITKAGFDDLKKSSPSFGDCVLVEDNPTCLSSWCVKWENPPRF